MRDLNIGLCELGNAFASIMFPLRVFLVLLSLIYKPIRSSVSDRPRNNVIMQSCIQLSTNPLLRTVLHYMINIKFIKITRIVSLRFYTKISNTKMNLAYDMYIIVQIYIINYNLPSFLYIINTARFETYA